jgi:hypothetical protein
MQVHMLKCGDARGVARHIKHLISQMKKAVGIVPQKQIADVEYLLEEMETLFLKAEDIQAKTL